MRKVRQGDFVGGGGDGAPSTWRLGGQGLAPLPDKPTLHERVTAVGQQREHILVNGKGSMSCITRETIALSRRQLKRWPLRNRSRSRGVTLKEAGERMGRSYRQAARLKGIFRLLSAPANGRALTAKGCWRCVSGVLISLPFCRMLEQIGESSRYDTVKKSVRNCAQAQEPIGILFLSGTKSEEPSRGRFSGPFLSTPVKSASEPLL